MMAQNITSGMYPKAYASKERGELPPWDDRTAGGFVDQAKILSKPYQFVRPAMMAIANVREFVEEKDDGCAGHNSVRTRSRM